MYAAYPELLTALALSYLAYNMTIWVCVAVQTLDILHYSAKTAHLNISGGNVMVNAQGSRCEARLINYRLSECIGHLGKFHAAASAFSVCFDLLQSIAVGGRHMYGAQESIV